MPMKIPEPSKAEAKALFRLGIVGDLLDLSREREGAGIRFF